VEKKEVERILPSSPERAILVALRDRKSNKHSYDHSLDELERLAETAGAIVTSRVVQEADAPNPGYYIGKGKAEEIGHLCYDLDSNLVIFDNELSPAQLRNLEKLIPARIIDRTQLILDIFAQRAHSREGKLQVELAQLSYLLPRLVGRGVEMSRLGGGIGTRGPGEPQLEVDRRTILRRIHKIKTRLKEVQKTRKLHRRHRHSLGLPTLALIGYTNAGKSTLMNRLTSAGVLVDDKLFATLDPTVRKLRLPDGMIVLLSDTVGFLRKLPHTLIAAFKATLEEVREADILLHVIDSSHLEVRRHIQDVYKVLKELEADQKPIISVYNKIDKLSGDSYYRKQLLGPGPAVAVSALEGYGIGELVKTIQEELQRIKNLVPETQPEKSYSYWI
jgi:GTP-binding protein HflX